MSSPFKAYDIRGIYPTEFDEDLAAAIARAFCRFTKAPIFVVAGDARLSTPFIKPAVIEGLLAEGASVLDIGVCPTPLLGFTLRQMNVEAGIMVSASHNPPDYTGLKLQTLGPHRFILQISRTTGLLEIEALAQDILKNSAKTHHRQGKLVKHDPFTAYAAEIKSYFPNIQGLKIAVDYANGVGGITARPILDDFDLEVHHLFTEPDGRFPHHLADPHHIENLATLQGEVTKKRLDAGFFFDGDADRVFAIDEKGVVVEPDIILGICATQELKKTPFTGGKIYHDLRASRAVVENIRMAGGEPIAMPVGNPPMKLRLAQEGGLMAGENTGHLMFPENGAVDDGLFTTLRILEVMTKTGQSLATLAEPFRRYARLPEFSLAFNFEKTTLFEKLKQAFKDARVSELDGLTLTTPDWSFNIRASNTEPVLRLNIEARDSKILKLVEKKLKTILSS